MAGHAHLADSHRYTHMSVRIATDLLVGGDGGRRPLRSRPPSPPTDIHTRTLPNVRTLCHYLYACNPAGLPPGWRRHAILGAFLLHTCTTRPPHDGACRTGIYCARLRTINSVQVFTMEALLDQQHVAGIRLPQLAHADCSLNNMIMGLCEAHSSTGGLLTPRPPLFSPCVSTIVVLTSVWPRSRKLWLIACFVNPARQTVAIMAFENEAA